MGTYLPLDSMKTKICGLKIRVRPCPSSDPNPGGFGHQGRRAEILDSTTQPRINYAHSRRQPGREHHREKGERMTIHPASVEASTTPLPSLE